MAVDGFQNPVGFVFDGLAVAVIECAKTFDHHIDQLIGGLVKPEASLSFGSISLVCKGCEHRAAIV